MSNVKYQHFLARHHMSWFANADGTSSFWSLPNGVLQDDVKLTEIGGQNNLYESAELERNFVEKQVLSKIETDFFAARSRAMVDRAVRKSDDRQTVRRYVTAQFIREGYLHKRIMNLERDLLFLAKEMGLERHWAAEGVPAEGQRKRASSTMAKSLIELDHLVKLLKHHVVIFVQRPQSDLLLPDRGFVQVYAENGNVRTDGLKSPTLKILMPIAPGAALKLVRPPKGAGFADRTTMGDKEYAEFIHNLGLNAKSFVAGTKQALAAVDFSEVPYFDPNAERLSMVMQIYRAGVLDRIVDNFWEKQLRYMPKDEVRAWFYREKFIPAINKLFNPDNDSNAKVIGFIP
ncbi:MAG: DUF4238 domain-containing protein [Allorhizobium sp.]